MVPSWRVCGETDLGVDRWRKREYAYDDFASVILILLNIILIINYYCIFFFLIVNIAYFLINSRKICLRVNGNLYALGLLWRST
ncbi:hypothetical protein HanIR_Chr14g0706281 [Helianthus annuus]|nr:hypothetical protein HanIR_Chr14g0706281 [Helianthus annuus]